MRYKVAIKVHLKDGYCANDAEMDFSDLEKERVYYKNAEAPREAGESAMDDFNAEVAIGVPEAIWTEATVTPLDEASALTAAAEAARRGIARLSSLRAFAMELKLGEEDLDEVVHEIKSGEAADINNAGLEAQLRFILGSCCGDVDRAKKAIS